MRIAIISVTENGRSLSEKINDFLSIRHEVSRFCFYKKTDGNAAAFSDINSLISEIFSNYNALVFVCACGIAVRSIAPFLKSKAIDPAVLVINDIGKFVIPILSGHLGGANRLAEIISEKTGAVPVITTATDIGGKFSPDSFALANNLIITDLTAAKELAAAVLSGEKIGIRSDFPYKNLPSCFLENTENTPCRAGVRISVNNNEKPFSITLDLIPKNLVLGIGCKRDTTCLRIEEQLAKAGGNIKRLCAVATIDIKANEEGLIKFCKKYKLPLFTYTAEQLMSVKGSFTRSDFVLSQTGTDNVCERAAVLYSGGRLIMAKHAENGVTLAVAEKPVVLDFEREIL